MDENKEARFWGAEKELRKLLLPIGAQLELTHHVLRAQLPKVQELFEQVTQLGEELGFHVDRNSLKPLYDYLGRGESLHSNDLFQNDGGTDNGQQK